MITELRDYSCEERLKEQSLETKRLRGDQIEVSKILNGYENIDRIICYHPKTIVELETRSNISKGKVKIRYQEVLVFTVEDE